MAEYPNIINGAAYHAMLGITDDRITVKERTLGYFKGNRVQGYRHLWKIAGISMSLRKQRYTD